MIFNDIKFHPNKNIIIHFIKSTNKIIQVKSVKFFFLLLFLTSLIFLRIQIQSFDIALRYLYILLIILSAFWFGLKGGLISSAIAFVIFLLEITNFIDFKYRAVVETNISLIIRFFAYFSGGIIIGYLSDLDKKLKKELKDMAYYDELTGCMNYRLIMEFFQKTLMHSVRNKEEMIIIMTDLDFFKKINDTYGHVIGNEFLKWFAGILKSSVREIDSIGRYGGDEFLIILPDCNVKQAYSVLKRIKNNINNKSLIPDNLKRYYMIELKFSAGLSHYPYNGNDEIELLKAADNALYHAKNSGKNNIFKERRKAVRIDKIPDLKIQIHNLNNLNTNENMTIINISKYGIYLNLSQSINKKNIVCRIHSDQWEEPINLFCSVTHKEKQNKNLYSYGLKYTNVPDAFEKLFVKIFHN
jgi:diguanylate cyclase (GGDEF)-like protein